MQRNRIFQHQALNVHWSTHVFSSKIEKDVCFSFFFIHLFLCLGLEVRVLEGKQE